ncbi:MAG: peptide ABC transporter substrate-binding protein [Clostridiales bacterium]|nr:peptide ABC transporter substrate-binding protein [Clostridiales bacterium]
MKRFFALLGVALLLMTGCTRTKTTTVSGDVAAQGVSIDKEEDIEDVITMSMSMAKTLNPLTNSDESVDRVLSLIYEKLINIGSDGKAEPNIADSWTFNDDGSVVYIELNRNVCFSDGTKLTAYDVAYSLKTIDNAENSYYKNCVENIRTWSVTGDYSISVTFYESTGRNIYYLAIPIISRTFYGGDYANENTNTDSALGTGLYRFESLQQPDELTLVASLNCFNGMAGVNRIEVIMTKDSETDINLFSQGITDILASDDTETAGMGNSASVKSVSYTTGEYDFIGFNFNNSILKDRNVRQTIAYAVDKDSIIEGIYLDNAEEAYTPVSSSSWLYDSSVYGYDYDLSMAKMLLEQSGWRYRSGSDTVRQSSGDNPSTLSLRLLVNSENNERRQVGIKLAEALRGLGFEITMETVDFETYQAKLNSGTFDIVVGGWSLSPVCDFTFMFGSEELNGESVNLINYSSTKMDEYLKACKSAVTDEDMQEAYAALQQYISQELPYISLVFRESKVYSGTRIDGELTPSQNNVFDGIENLTIKK